MVMALVCVALSGCREPGADDISDPVDKAAFHCRYVLERAVADPSQLSPDGVLRRRIAAFADPAVERTADIVRFVWSPGAITEDDGSGTHGGDCVMNIADSQQLLVSATLDSNPLHAGYRF